MHLLEETQILLVDDNPDDVKLALRAFQKSGITNPVAVACDGVEALEYLHGTGKFAGRDPSVLPALVLLDLKLPRISGVEVLQSIRANERMKAMPVVIFSTSDEESDRLACVALGANDYLRKPLRFSDFGEIVQRLARWLVLPSSGRAVPGI